MRPRRREFPIEGVARSRQYEPVVVRTLAEDQARHRAIVERWMASPAAKTKPSLLKRWFSTTKS